METEVNADSSGKALKFRLNFRLGVHGPPFHNHKNVQANAALRASEQSENLHVIF